MFILPKCVLKRIAQISGNFLGNGKEFKSAGAKTAQEKLVLTKKRGALAIKDLLIGNNALSFEHIWHLFSLKNNLWVKWIQAYHLVNKSFWAVKYWRNLLKLRLS